METLSIISLVYLTRNLSFENLGHTNSRCFRINQSRLDQFKPRQYLFKLTRTIILLVYLIRKLSVKNLGHKNSPCFRINWSRLDQFKRRQYLFKLTRTNKPNNLTNRIKGHFLEKSTSPYHATQVKSIMVQPTPLIQAPVHPPFLKKS